MSKSKIERLVEALPVGGKAQYEGIVTGVSTPQRFLALRRNFDYFKPRLLWKNEPEWEKKPCAPSRGRKFVDMNSLPPAELRFEGKLNQLADIYHLNDGALFISKKLLSIISDMDPEALTCRQEAVDVKGASVEFFMVMPGRVLSAVDADRTTIRIQDKSLADIYVRSVGFPADVFFQEDIDNSVHVFWDCEFKGWLWSRTLIETCRPLGIRGVNAEKTTSSDPGGSYLF